jgi:hypothetical protein
VIGTGNINKKIVPPMVNIYVDTTLSNSSQHELNKIDKRLDKEVKEIKRDLRIPKPKEKYG